MFRLLHGAQDHYDCCDACGDEELQSTQAIWLLGVWRAILLGLLHAFQPLGKRGPTGLTDRVD